jgi:hypothetical protein
MWWKLAVPAIFILAACGPRMTSIQQRAARDFGCSDDRVSVIRRSSNTYVATGCNRQGVYQCARRDRCVDVLALAKDRGRRELRCAAVRVEELSPRVFRVAGCEAEATYRCKLIVDAFRCVLESIAREAPSVPLTPVGEPTQI